ncbi:TonB-dependent receptor [Novosphingobium sp.]|uniref:TonB-dependent receptor n=1 Tax=Novosphingobium sp. TaxID=1874826 RepID=UPI003D11E480
MSLRLLLTAAAPLALIAAHPALAAAPAAAPSVPPAATTSADADDGIILVTARHRAETSQAVPISLSVLDAAHIDRTGAFNIDRVQQLTPTLQFYSQNPRNTSLNIRGLGATLGLTNDGIEPGVGVYVDDVYYARPASATFDFLDVERVEVLRGPQGTLYGKNTTAGAINITTRPPSFDFTARGEASVGNEGFYQFKGAVSGPLSDKVAVRLAISSTNRDGNVLNAHTGKEINGQNNIGGRGQILWKPSDSVRITLAADYNRQNPDCCGFVYVRVGETQRAQNRQFNALAQTAGYTPPSTNPFARIADLDTPLRALNEVGGVSLKAVVDTGIGTVTSVTAWRFWHWDPSNDRDYTGLPVTTVSQNPSQQHQVSQELRLTHEGKTLDFTVGLFGFDQVVRTEGSQVQGSAASKWLLAPSASPTNCYNTNCLDGLSSTNSIGLRNDSVALYGQLTWKPTGSFSIQPGVRVNYDYKNGYYSSVVTNAAGAPVQFATAPAVNTSAQLSQLSQLAPENFNAIYSAWNVSYDVTASYAFNRDIHGYASYAHTFKSGGINLNGVPAAANGAPLLQFASIKPENEDHFEVGIKTQWLGRRLTINADAFRTEIHNYQALVNNGQQSALRGYVDSAPFVRVQGAEWDITLRPSPRFNAYFNGAYNDAKYIRFPAAPCPPELSGGTAVAAGQTAAPAGVPGLSPVSCDISGQRLPGISKLALSFGGEANLPVTLLSHAGEFYAGVDGNYRSSFSSNSSPSAYTWVNGYTLTNVRAGFRTEHGFDIYGWVRNAFNVGYYQQLLVGPGSTGLIVGQLGDPRTYGVTARFVL